MVSLSEPFPRMGIEEFQALLKTHGYETDDPIISTALAIAMKAHLTQFRDNGETYLTGHVIPVTAMLIEYYALHIQEDVDGNGNKIEYEPLTSIDIAAALNHDIMEMQIGIFRDDQYGWITEFKSHYSDEQVSLAIYAKVELLTHRKKEEQEGATILEKRINADIEAIAKVQDAPLPTIVTRGEDRGHNILCLPIPGNPQKTSEVIESTTRIYLPFVVQGSRHRSDRYIDRLRDLTETDSRLNDILETQLENLLSVDVA